MKTLVQTVVLFTFVTLLVGMAATTVSGQQGALVVSNDLSYFAGPNLPRNCFAVNRYKVGEPVGFRVSVIDGATGKPASDAEVVVHLNYGGKTVDVPARYRGVVPAGGRGNPIPNLWTAKWMVPADAPTGVVKVTITAKDKSGRTGMWEPYPNPASHLTIVTE